MQCLKSTLNRRNCDIWQYLPLFTVTHRDGLRQCVGQVAPRVTVSVQARLACAVRAKSGLGFNAVNGTSLASAASPPGIDQPDRRLAAFDHLPQTIRDSILDHWCRVAPCRGFGGPGAGGHDQIFDDGGKSVPELPRT